MDLKEELTQYFTTSNHPFKNEGVIVKSRCMRCQKENCLIFDFETEQYHCEDKHCEVNGDIRDFIPANKPNKSNDPDDLTIISCQELLDYEIQPEFFIINPLVPKQAITSITADSGKGKSLFALILAQHIASGSTLFDKYKVDQGKVLIVDQEMNKNEIATRFKKLVSGDLPIDYIIEQKFSIIDKDNFNYLSSRIIENNYNVVIFDTFTEIHDKEENDSGEMKQVNKQLLELIRLTSVSIIYLHHHRKLQKNEKQSQSSSRGSSEIIAKVSSHLLLDSKHYVNEFGSNVLEITISQEKARSSSRLDEKISFKIFNNIFTDKMELEYLGEVIEKTKKIEEAKTYIIQTLQDIPGATVKSLEERSEIGNNNLRLALKELTKENKIDSRKEGQANYYFLNKS